MHKILDKEENKKWRERKFTVFNERMLLCLEDKMIQASCPFRING